MHQRLSALIVLFVLLLASFAASAQPYRDQGALDGWSGTLSRIEIALDRPSLSTARLDAYRRDVQAVRDASRDFVEGLKPRMAEVRDRLASIAPPEDVDVADLPALAEARAVLEDQLERLTGFHQQAQLTNLQAKQLLDKIASLRGTQFAAALFAHDRSALSPNLFSDIAAETPRLVLRIGAIVGSWGALITESSDFVTLMLVMFAVVLVIAILIARGVFLRWARGPAATQEPTRNQKYVMALAIVIVDTAVPIVMLFGLRALLSELNLLPRDFGDILYGLTSAVAIFTVITGLARALAAPQRPAWRIARVANQTARQLFALVVIAATIMAANALIGTLATVATMPAFYGAGVGGILAIPTAVLALVATRVLVRGRAALSTEERVLNARWRLLTPLAGLAAVVTIVAAVAGYLLFASFMIGQIAWVWVVIGGLVLASGLAEAALSPVLVPDNPAGSRFAQALGVSNRAVNQIGVVFTALVKVVLLIAAALLIAAPWGFDSSSIMSRLQGLYYGIQIGSIRITFSTVLTAAIIFGVLIGATRLFQNWLNDRFLPTTAIEPGLKNSIRVSAGYLGLFLAVILAATYAGFDLASIALVAGALSVGIGFGLQSIVNNFVSGLILLAERPIRAGDWIQVGPDQGTVKRISVRATEIETFDRASVVIPNSNLISGVVTNWYLRGNIGRIIIPVGVSYDSDPEQVKEVLLACATAHERVTEDPAPAVFFMDFGASSLDFELRCHLFDISSGLTTRSDLRFAILAALREAGIEIPFPQRDLHLRDLPAIEGALAGNAGAEAKTGGGSVG